MPASPKTSLSGSGRLAFVESQVRHPETVSALKDIVLDSGAHPILARGAGRSYGDAALNADGETVMTERLNRILAFDEATGLLRCQAGVLLQDILRVFVPRGWFLPVTPGTKFVTVGGAIAFDVHGKNHHRDGALSHFVRSFDLLTASGEEHTCSRTENQELFFATVSGMGLTGVITQVELQLKPIDSALIDLYSVKARNLDEAFELFDEHEPNYQYSVAWIDCLASGAALGRSILMFGDHAQTAGLTPARQERPLYLKPKRRFSIPFELPSGLLNPLTIRAFNTLYYARQRAKEVRTVVDYEQFFYPLDFLHRWNRMYGKKGFVQYQCVFPSEQSRAGLVEILKRCSAKRRASFLAVLKCLGSEDEGYLSFTMKGYTLSLDIPFRKGLPAFLAELDEVLLRHGGRVYLAKDAFLKPESFRAMYPNFDQWRQVKSKIDPHYVFSSALSRRLQITPQDESHYPRARFSPSLSA